MSGQLVRFLVHGRPVPQGSTRAFALKKGKAAGKIITTNDPTGSIGKWRGDIRSVAETVKPATPTAGPVRLSLVFRFARPQGHYLPATKSRPAGILRENAPTLHVGAPDIDKLARSVLDALTGLIYLDDGQVFDLATRKLWGEPGEPGLVVEAGWSDEQPAPGSVLAAVVADPSVALGQEDLGL